MPVNSSSDFGFTFPCMDVNVIFMFNAVIMTKVLLLLPLSIFVLYLGHQRWRRRSLASSHSDVFTYHVASMQPIYALGSIAFFCSQLTDLFMVGQVGLYVSSFTFPGELFFHVLTCVERYLAVVHPVTYLGLRQSGGVRIRNACIVCVWLLCLGWIGVAVLYSPEVPYVPYFCTCAVALVIVSFCSLSILHVLIRPGPGEKGGNKERVDQTKQRAFYTITAITGVLWVFFLGVLIVLAVGKSHLLNDKDRCLALVCSNWFCLPSSLVSPLLFLHRAGKLPVFKGSTG